MRFPVLSAFVVTLCLAGCARLGAVGQTPPFSPVDDSLEVRAMTSPGLPMTLETTRRADAASTWSGTRSSLLGDRRANLRGDILTVVIEIDDSAEISNSSSRSRSGSEALGIGGLFGLPQMIDQRLPDGEVRVNNEIRELIVTGFVRSEDISRQNEITYDKIASARISYGGRGQISDVQQPRYGQQISDVVLPF